MASRPRASALASNLLAKPGGAPPRSAAIEDLPRRAEPPAESDGPSSGGIKGRTVGTTLYLLPTESRRLKRLALDLDISVHELVLRGLDRMLAEQGQAPVVRYSSPKPRKP